MHPYPTERRNANTPGGHTSQYAAPGHAPCLARGERVHCVLLDVPHLRLGDARMCFRAVEREQVPGDAPGHTDAARRVEHGAPAKVCDEETAQRVRDTDADTEALERGHEATALRCRYPVAHQGVHGGPGEAGGEALDTAQCDDEAVVCDAGYGDAQAAGGCGQLCVAEYTLGTEFLGGVATDDLRDDVSPVERGEYVALYIGRPVQSATVLLHIQPVTTLDIIVTVPEFIVNIIKNK